VVLLAVAVLAGLVPARATVSSVAGAVENFLQGSLPEAGGRAVPPIAASFATSLISLARL
jgi:hypothetical protein